MSSLTTVRYDSSGLGVLDVGIRAAVNPSYTSARKEIVTCEL